MEIALFHRRVIAPRFPDFPSTQPVSLAPVLCFALLEWFASDYLVVSNGGNTFRFKSLAHILYIDILYIGC